MKQFILPTCVALLVFSCSQVAEKSAVTDIPGQEARAQLASVPQTDIYSDGKTKLIKSVDYRFEVENVKKSTEAIEIAVKKYPAYIAASNLRLENPFLENKITIRVQSEYFQDLLKEIDKQARFVNFRNVETEDVAKEFVDLESRLKTKREVEERYVEILRKKAGTIEELLNAEQKIGELHEEIEATISRINFLRDQVSYSTINLEFYQTITQEIAAADGVTRKDEFAKALKSGWEGTMTVALLFAYIWPVFVIGVAAGIIIKFLKRKKTLQFKQV